MSTRSLELPAEVETLTNPFPGLRRFEYFESHLFFGREGQSQDLIDKLGQQRFLAVVGTSGSGKSSLVRAGLLPALFGGFMKGAGSAWRVAVMQPMLPSNDPIGNLALALNDTEVFGSEDEKSSSLKTTLTETTLRRSSRGLIEAVREGHMARHEKLLLVIDQFEELFRFAQVAEGEEYENESAAFVKLFLEAYRQTEVPIYVVLTMRSDYLGDCSQFQGLPEAINDAQYLIPRMTRDQRRSAITGPVAVGNGSISPRLVNRLLNDMGDNPDQLPILQHAMMRCWDKWLEEKKADEPLDIRHYEAIGGMEKALSNHANEAFAELTGEKDRALAEKIFKCLTDKGKYNRETRRQCTLLELCLATEADEADVIKVIEIFRKPGRSFLMPPSNIPLMPETVIDISHESLIRNWQKLRDWVEEEAKSARTYIRLAESTNLYHKGETGLLTDPELENALEWRREYKPNKFWARRYHADFDTVNSFLDKSLSDRDAKERASAEQQQKEEQRKKYLFYLKLAIPALLLLLAALALAISQYFSARDAKIRAEIAGKEAQEARSLAERSDKANSQIFPLLNELLFDLEDLPRTRQRFEDMRSFYSQSQNTLGEAIALASLGETWFMDGDMVKAESSYLSALEKMKKSLPGTSGNEYPDHPYVAQTLNKLGIVYLNPKDWQKAEKPFTDASNILKRFYGTESLEEANSLNGLAAIRQFQGRNSEAEEYFKKALSIDEKFLGLDHRQVVLDRNNLAKFYYGLGRKDEARKELEAVPGIEKAAEGRCDSTDQARLRKSKFICKDLATSYINSAVLLTDFKDFQKAEEMVRKALPIHEALLQPDDYLLSTDYNNIAYLYENWGKYEDSARYYQKSLNIREKKNNPAGIANVLSGLGYSYQKLGRFDESNKAYLKAIKIYESIGYVEALIETTKSLTESYLAQNNRSEADKQPSYLIGYAEYLRDYGTQFNEQINELEKAADELGKSLKLKD